MAGKMQPVLSVIIAAFNAAEFLAEGIRSVLSQSYQDFELIVVDDGSQDDTAEIVRSIRDTRVHLVSQANRGQSAALNAGVANSSGRFIKFLDADDCLNPLHLESMLRALDGNDNCVASCRWGYFVIDANCPQVRSEAVQRDFHDPIEWLVTSLTKDEGMMGGWMWLIPRTVWNRCGGWNEQLSLNNDFDFSIRLLLASEGVRYASEAVYSYRKGVAGALSASYGRKAMESAFLTTDLGTRALLAKEDTDRIRRIAADRFQNWLFQFYPEFPDLVAAAEKRIKELGGSSLELQGGRVQRMLSPLLGWKRLRRLQVLVRRVGWRHVLTRKAKSRLSRLK